MPRLLLVVPALLLFASVLVGGHWYLAQRLVVDAALPPGAHALLLGAVVAGGVSLVLQPVGERLLSPPWSRLIAWPASLWMGLFFYLFLLVAFSDLLLGLGGLVFPKPLYAAAGVPDAPGGAGRVRAAAVLVAALAFVAVGLRGRLRGPCLVRRDVVLPRWPRALDGFRIVQISDIHIGPILGRAFARELVDRVNALAPDLVAVTGDLVDGSVRRLRDEVTPFGELRGRYGVFFVTGNHDHYSGADGWSARLRELGFRILRNERVTIDTREGAPFELAGVDDHRSGFESGRGGEDLDAALAGVPPAVPWCSSPTTRRPSSAPPPWASTFSSPGTPTAARSGPSRGSCVSRYPSWPVSTGAGTRRCT